MTEAERSHYIRILRFPPRLERAFQQEYFATYRMSLQITLVVSTLLAVCLCSLELARHRPFQATVIGYGTFCLCNLVGLFLSTRKNIHRYWQPGVVASSLLLVGAETTSIASALGSGEWYGNVPPTPDLRLQVVVLTYWVMVGLVVPAVMRLQFRWTLLYVIACIGSAYWAALKWMKVPVFSASGSLMDAVPGLAPLAGGLLMAVFSQERQHRAAFLTNELLESERAKSENLLANMMPACIAERLKSAPDSVADHHDEVTVLFADIVDFTPFASGKSAREVVHVLNEIFSRFDRLVEQHGLEKIKTVGDCYMVIAGAPTWRPDHLERSARLALDMQEEAAELSQETGWPVQFRIGMHTGPLVAGVIGEKRFLYDVWGDTVNTASRLESHGIPGRIQVSAEVAEKLRTDFLLQRRGEVEIKGKGRLETFFLQGESTQRSDRSIPGV